MFSRQSLIERLDKGALARSDFFAGLVRFFLAGGVSTLTYFCLTILFAYAFSWRPITASLIAYGISLCVSWLMQSRFVFRKSGGWKHKIRFLALGLFGLLIAQTVFYFGEYQTVLTPWMLAALVSVLIPALNFVAMNFWVFLSGVGKNE